MPVCADRDINAAMAEDRLTRSAQEHEAARGGHPHVFWALGILAALGLGGVMSWGGTAIAVLHTKTEAVIAADSKITIYSAGGAVRAIETCKLHVVDDAVFAIAGTVGGTSFSAEQIVTDSLRGAGSLLDKVRRFEGRIEQPLRGHLQALYNEDPLRLTRDIRNGIVLDVVFLRMEAGAPAVYARGFRLGPVANGSPTMSLEQSDCPGPNCSEPLTALLLGDQEASRATSVALLSGRPVPDDLITPAVRIVESEIEATPSTVGGPVAVVRLDRAGIHWIRRGRC